MWPTINQLSLLNCVAAGNQFRYQIIWQAGNGFRCQFSTIDPRAEMTKMNIWTLEISMEMNVI